MEHVVAVRPPVPIAARERTAMRPPLRQAAPKRPSAALPLARPARWPAIATIVAVHVAVLALLLSDARPPRTAPRPPVQVELIAAPPAPELPKPTVPPRARRVQPPPAPPVVDTPPPVPAIEPQRLAESVMPVAPPVHVEGAPTPTLAAATPASPAPAQEAVTPPRFDAAYLDNPAPAYPPLARRMREEGRVLLRVLVGADGRAERVEVASSSGSERLDRAALDAVRRWRFVPARRGDEALAAHVTVPIVFSLDRA